MITLASIFNCIELGFISFFTLVSFFNLMLSYLDYKHNILLDFKHFILIYREAMSNDERLDLLSFTGSTKVSFSLSYIILIPYSLQFKDFIIE